MTRRHEMMTTDEQPEYDPKCLTGFAIISVKNAYTPKTVTFMSTLADLINSLWSESVLSTL